MRACVYDIAPAEHPSPAFKTGRELESKQRIAVHAAFLVQCQT
jgi:hypothetical protein